MSQLQPVTYVTKRVPIIGNPNQRTGASTAKDQIFVNFYPSEMKGLDGTKYMLEQRAGLVYKQSTVFGEGRGIYYWNGSTFAVVANQLFRDGVMIQVLSTSTGSVGFHEFANETNQVFLVVLDGISGWVVNQAFTVTKITDANFPTPHVPKGAYMDGYLFVAKVNTGDIYNSNLLDPMTWTAGDFISAESFPDTVVALVRQNNYVVAVGQQTTEFFYDTGAYPGTPLARNAGALHQFGTPAPSTVAQIEEQVIFVGQTQTGGRTVWTLNGFNPAEIGTEVVRQSLDHEGTNIVNAKAFYVRSKGHKFYVLNLTSVTWVFDFDTQIWHQWADVTGVARFNCDYATDSRVGYPILLDKIKGYTYILTEGTSTDAIDPYTSANIISTAVSDKMDFGSMNGKTMNRLSLICDTPYGNNQVSILISWTDDDYQSYTPGRYITLSNTMPVITQLGRFRRRAFKLVYADASPIRIEGFEMDLNLGSQ